MHGLRARPGRPLEPWEPPVVRWFDALPPRWRPLLLYGTLLGLMLALYPLDRPGGWRPDRGHGGGRVAPGPSPARAGEAIRRDYGETARDASRRIGLPAEWASTEPRFLPD